MYSIDIETDPIWGDYRDLALQHGFRSCWSTPIRNSNGTIIGTFAILHRTVGRPTQEEIEAIDMITGHVADAIMWFRDPPNLASPVLTLVSDNTAARDPTHRLVELADKLRLKAAEADRYADLAASEAEAQQLRKAAELSRKVLSQIELQIERVRSGKSQ